MYGMLCMVFMYGYSWPGVVGVEVQVLRLSRSTRSFTIPVSLHLHLLPSNKVLYYNKKFMLYFSAVPDHLRTKYEPEVEDKESVLSAATANISSESTQVYRYNITQPTTQPQARVYNKLCTKYKL